MGFAGPYVFLITGDWELGSSKPPNLGGLVELGPCAI